MDYYGNGYCMGNQTCQCLRGFKGEDCNNGLKDETNKFVTDYKLGNEKKDEEKEDKEDDGKKEEKEEKEEEEKEEKEEEEEEREEEDEKEAEKDPRCNRFENIIKVYQK